jgi:hypothetical protein
MAVRRRWTCGSISRAPPRSYARSTVEGISVLIGGKHRRGCVSYTKGGRRGAFARHDVDLMRDSPAQLFGLSYITM